MSIQNVIGKVKLGAKRNAPELLLGLGVVAGTACVVTTGKASLKAGKIHDRMKEDSMTLSDVLESCQITEEEFKKEIRGVYTKYALDLAKEFALPVGLYAVTVASVFASYKIQKNRQLALSAALTACTTAYAGLVAKLRSGAEHGLTAQEVIDGVEVKTTVNEETGEVTTEKVQGAPVESLYNIRFDRYSTAWEKDKFQNEATLRSEENWANDRLRLQGYIFLNDIYDRLGLPRTKHGQIVGWVSNGDGDNFVDFGIKDASEYEDVRFDANAFDLEFNVDGDILSKF